MAIIHALDVPPWANGDGSAITRKQAKEALDQGYELLIVNLHTGKDDNKTARDSLRNARLAGVKTAAYFALSSQTAKWHFDRAKEMAGDEWGNLLFVAVDVELPWVKEANVPKAIDLVAKDGLRPIVYTAAWFWRYTWDNPTIAKDTPLWDADYDDNGRFDKFVWYGGWTRRIGKQYNSKAADVGFLADANVFDAEWLGEWNLSPELSPENPLVWYGLYDAVAGGTQGTIKPLARERNGWGEYQVSIKGV